MPRKNPSFGAKFHKVRETFPGISIKDSESNYSSQKIASYFRIAPLIRHSRRLWLFPAYEWRRNFFKPKFMPISFFRRVSHFWDVSENGILGNPGSFLSRFTAVHLVFEVFQTWVARFCFCLNRITNAVTDIFGGGWRKSGENSGKPLFRITRILDVWSHRFWA